MLSPSLSIYRSLKTFFLNSWRKNEISFTNWSRSRRWMPWPLIRLSILRYAPSTWKWNLFCLWQLRCHSNWLKIFIREAISSKSSKLAKSGIALIWIGNNRSKITVAFPFVMVMMANDGPPKNKRMRVLQSKAKSALSISIKDLWVNRNTVICIELNFFLLFYHCNWWQLKLHKHFSRDCTKGQYFEELALLC